MRALRRLAIIAGVVFALTACWLFFSSQRVPQPRTVPLPKIDAGKVSLRVAHAINPRFPKLSDAQFAALLQAAAQTAQRHFGVQVTYEPTVTTVSLNDVLRSVPKPIAAHSRTLIDAARGPADRQRLAGAYHDNMVANPAPSADVIAYARRLGAKLQTNDLRDLAGYLADHHIDRIGALRTATAADGKPLVDDSPYNEIIFWDTVGQADLPFDLFVTNQPILSLEYQGVDVHTGMRGGISVGMTFYSRAGRYGAAAVWSTYPFTAQSAPFPDLRGGSLQPDEVATLAGTLMAHEFGHLLFHFGHPFGNAACIMHPVPLLKFREQVAALDPERCPVGSSPAMKPGALPIPYYE